MSNAKLKPTLARAKLAEVIAARDGIERKIAIARDAVEQARAKKWAAEERLESLQKQKAESSAAHSPGDIFMASLAAGEACDVAVLERPASTRDEDALEREIALWAKTQAECEAEIPLLESALGFAEYRVEEAAREAVKASSAVQELLDGLGAIHDELDRRLSALALLRFRNMVSEGDKEAVRAATGRPVLLGEHHPICAEWDTAFKKLTRNADTHPPGDKI
jgi:hypothetical protein